MTARSTTPTPMLNATFEGITAPSLKLRIEIVFGGGTATLYNLPFINDSVIQYGSV